MSLSPLARDEDFNRLTEEFAHLAPSSLRESGELFVRLPSDLCPYVLKVFSHYGKLDVEYVLEKIESDPCVIWSVVPLGGHVGVMCLQVIDDSRESQLGAQRFVCSGAVFIPVTYVLGRHDGWAVVCVSALVPRLLARGRPLAIARLVIAVVVDAFDRVIRGRLSPHVAFELFNVVEPRITDTNAATAIIFITDVFCVSAALAHGMPRAAYDLIDGACARTPSH